MVAVCGYGGGGLHAPSNAIMSREGGGVMLVLGYLIFVVGAGMDHSEMPWLTWIWVGIILLLVGLGLAAAWREVR